MNTNLTRRSMLGKTIGALGAAVGATAMGVFPELKMSTARAASPSANKPWFTQGVVAHQSEVTGAERQAILSGVRPGFNVPSSLPAGSGSAVVVRNVMRDGTTITSAGVLIDNDHALAHYARNDGRVTDILYSVHRDSASAQPSRLETLAVSHGAKVVYSRAVMPADGSCTGCFQGCCQYCSDVNWSGISQCCVPCGFAGPAALPCILAWCLYCYDVNCNNWTLYCCG